MLSIKEGNYQPLDCPKCKSKMGYQVTKKIISYIDNIFDLDGKYISESASEHYKIIKHYKRAHCSNCGTKLPFTIKP
jgi:DNA-directed RNA polymerase subunit RPC12/RpoP